MNEEEKMRDNNEALRGQVRAHYGEIAEGGGCCSGTTAAGDSCCGGGDSAACCSGTGVSTELGYTDADLSELPEGANLGLGCGNPTAFATLKPGETVLDLGSGAGIDCFLASKKVGPTGNVVGVDMTPEMVAKARKNARAGGYANVDFRLGEIEHLPVADRSVDVIISNCVINLALDKRQVYREAFRALKPGGRLAISDVVATRPISPAERANTALWSSCSSGALEVSELRSILESSGFEDIRVEPRSVGVTPSSLEGQASLGVVSADIRAIRPLRE
jgi:SAM-dependent methyltransferase